MRVAVTGTRLGLNPLQHAYAEALLKNLHARGGPHTLIHGDCVGVDAELDTMARALGWSIEIHPSNLLTRAYCGRDGDLIAKPRDARKRNTDIVAEADIVLAFPAESSRGTRDAILKAWDRGRRVVIIERTGLKNLALRAT